jgi:hypothetical protein
MQGGKAWMRPTVTLALMGCLLALAVSSCGKSGPKFAPVEGKVTLTDGKLVAFGYVVLYPDAGRGNTSMDRPTGGIVDGFYSVQTGAKKGAPLGVYKVGIEAGKVGDAANPYFTEWLADEIYVNPERSNLRMEVVENPEPGRYDFKLRPHPTQKKKK